MSPAEEAGFCQPCLCCSQSLLYEREASLRGHGAMSKDLGTSQMDFCSAPSTLSMMPACGSCSLNPHTAVFRSLQRQLAAGRRAWVHHSIGLASAQRIRYRLRWSSMKRLGSERDKRSIGAPQSLCEGFVHMISRRWGWDVARIKQICDGLPHSLSPHAGMICTRHIELMDALRQGSCNL